MLFWKITPADIDACSEDDILEVVWVGDVMIIFFPYLKESPKCVSLNGVIYWYADSGREFDKINTVYNQRNFILNDHSERVVA